MKNVIKIAALTGSLLAASFANAGIITITQNATSADEASLLAIMNNSITETFDAGGITCIAGATTCTSDSGFVLASEGFETSVGTFEQVLADGSNSEPAGQLMQIQIEDSSTGEFGREMPFAGNWLDSNDSDEIRWTIGDAASAFTVNSFGFFISDANDQGAVLTLIFTNGTTTSASLAPNLANGNEAYVRYVGAPSDDIAGFILRFDNGTNNNDGFGIDNVTIGYVSAPHTLLLLSLSILGIVALRKRG